MAVATAQEVPVEEEKESEAVTDEPAVTTAPAVSENLEAEPLPDHVNAPEEASHEPEPEQPALEDPHTASVGEVAEQTATTGKEELAAESTEEIQPRVEAATVVESNGHAVESEATDKAEAPALEVTTAEDVVEAVVVTKDTEAAEESEIEKEETGAIAEAVHEKEVESDAVPEVPTGDEVKLAEEDTTPEPIAPTEEHLEEVLAANVTEVEDKEVHHTSEVVAEAEPSLTEATVEHAEPTDAAVPEGEVAAVPVEEAVPASEPAEEPVVEEEPVAEESKPVEQTVETAEVASASAEPAATEPENAEGEAKDVLTNDSTILNRDVEQCDSTNKLVIISTSENACLGEPDPALDAETTVPAAEEAAPPTANDVPVVEEAVEGKPVVEEAVVPEAEEHEAEANVEPASESAITSDTQEVSEVPSTETVEASLVAPGW